jgi:hypothetical protein
MAQLAFFSCAAHLRPSLPALPPSSPPPTSRCHVGPCCHHPPQAAPGSNPIAPPLSPCRPRTRAPLLPWARAPGFSSAYKGRRRVRRVNFSPNPSYPRFRAAAAANPSSAAAVDSPPCRLPAVVKPPRSSVARWGSHRCSLLPSSCSRSLRRARRLSLLREPAALLCCAPPSPTESLPWCPSSIAHAAGVVLVWAALGIESPSSGLVELAGVLVRAAAPVALSAAAIYAGAAAAAWSLADGPDRSSRGVKSAAYRSTDLLGIVLHKNPCSF